MNRLLGILITGVWLVAMAALIKRDMLPYWTAQETPKGFMPAGEHQIAIRNAAGQRMGTTWITMRGGTEPTVSSTTEFNIAGLKAILPGLDFLILDTNLTYSTDGSLDAFKFALHGANMPIQVSGERYVRDFACTARFGSITRTMPLDAGVSQALSDSVRPFTHLKDLQVGQSWRLRLLNPLTLVRGEKVEFETQVAQVKARETIDHGGRRVEAFRIETPSAVAWADDDGRVLRQEVTMPFLGKWTMEEEPFDGKARQVARAKTRGEDESHKLQTEESIAAETP